MGEKKTGPTPARHPPRSPPRGRQRGKIMDEKKTAPTMAHDAPFRRTGARRRSARRLLGATATGMLAALALGAPANAALTGVGPTNADTGFPDWYQDQSGLRLELCVRNEDPFCTSTAPNPGPPTVAADPADSNFPEETFYWSGDALIDKRAVGVRARLVLAQEAAFVNGTPTKGDQMTFGRIRVRID